MQASAWLSFARSPTLSLAADAKRLGSPAEDTICYFGVDPEQRVGTWFPPQVLPTHLCGAPGLAALSVEHTGRQSAK